MVATGLHRLWGRFPPNIQPAIRQVVPAAPKRRDTHVAECREKKNVSNGTLSGLDPFVAFGRRTGWGNLVMEFALLHAPLCSRKKRKKWLQAGFSGRRKIKRRKKCQPSGWSCPFGPPSFHHLTVARQLQPAMALAQGCAEFKFAAAPRAAWGRTGLGGTKGLDNDPGAGVSALDRGSSGPAPPSKSKKAAPTKHQKSPKKKRPQSPGRQKGAGPPPAGPRFEGSGPPGVLGDLEENLSAVVWGRPVSVELQI